MKRNIHALTVLVLLGVLVYSCDIINEPANFKVTDNRDKSTSFTGSANSETTDSDIISGLLEAHESVLLNTYLVEFTGRETHETNGSIVSTTFNYRVSGTGQTPQMDSFFLETPSCAGTPVSWNLEQSASLVENGIRWNKSVSKNGSENFSITYSGNIPIGLITTVVVRASVSQSGDIIGPCKGVYTLSGNIFIDANEDGIKQSSESGIQNVPVTLAEQNSAETIGTVYTSSGGFYSFQVLNGDYTISVPEDLLDGSYNATTATSADLNNVTGDVSGIDFGYAIDAEKIIRDLEDDVILTNTEPVKYWEQQVRHAGKRNSDYTVSGMLDLLNDIENLLLPVPFQFGDDKLKEALNILTRPIKTELDAFLRELLAAELNVLSNRGAYIVVNGSVELNDGFNEALLIYGEALACEAMGECSNTIEQVHSLSSFSSFTTATLSSGTSVLSAFNGTGGIGTK